MIIVEAGMLAVSKAGHDLKKIYVIIKKDDEYVYLCDGNIRRVDNPKKKKYKHIQVIKVIPEEIKKCLDNDQIPDNDIVKRVIKQYKDRNK